MQKRKVLGAMGVTVPAGVAMKLTTDQYRRRAGHVEAIDSKGNPVEFELKKGADVPEGQVFRTTGPTMFKHAELVELDDVKSLIHKDALGDPTDEEAAAAPKSRRSSSKKKG